MYLKNQTRYRGVHQYHFLSRSCAYGFKDIINHQHACTCTWFECVCLSVDDNSRATSYTRRVMIDIYIHQESEQGIVLLLKGKKPKCSNCQETRGGSSRIVHRGLLVPSFQKSRTVESIIIPSARLAWCLLGHHKLLSRNACYNLCGLGAHSRSPKVYCIHLCNIQDLCHQNSLGKQ